jgi:hypothetical protein
VRFVKLTMLGNQTPDFETNCPDGAFSGCQYTDVSEIDVCGTESPLPPACGVRLEGRRRTLKVPATELRGGRGLVCGDLMRRP